MDIPIKAKSYELEAVAKLNDTAPEIYKGKNPGFYWAAHQASLQANKIDWRKVAEYRLDKLFTDESYDNSSPIVSHLTLDDEDYKKTSEVMTEQFELKRPVQKAYCARNIIKWAIMNLEKEDKNIYNEKNKEKELEDFFSLTLDEKLNKIYEKLIDIERV